MRASEFLGENASAGATASGSIATVSQPMGSVIKRTGFGKPAKYMNSLKPAKRKKSLKRF